MNELENAAWDAVIAMKEVLYIEDLFHGSDREAGRELKKAMKNLEEILNK